MYTTHIIKGWNDRSTFQR